MHNTSEPTNFAALDLGSNSFHLVIARKVEGQLQILHKEKHRVHLAAGLDEHFKLSDDAIERAILAFKQLANSLDGLDPNHVKVVATYTLRNITNLDDFLTHIERVFPYPINIIPGQEEARLIYQGVANFIHSEKNRLIIDIGGGSTELVIGKHFDPKLLSSRNVGCSSLMKHCFSSGKLTKSTFKKAEIFARQEFEEVAGRYKKLGWQQAIGTSGTIKALLGVAQEQYGQSHLTLEVLEQIKGLLINAGSIEQIDIKGLAPERHRNIAGGLAILIAAFKELKIESLEYCDYALREGVLFEMLNYEQFDIRARTIVALGQHYNIDAHHADNVFDTVKHLFDQVNHDWKLTQSDLLLLQWASQLHEAGLAIDSSGLQKHSAYIVMNTPLPGFTQQQQQWLSALIRFHRKKIKPLELESFEITKIQRFSRLLCLLRLAIIINRTRQVSPLSYPELTVNKQHIHIRFFDQVEEEQALLCADLEQEQKYLNTLEIDFNFSLGE